MLSLGSFPLNLIFPFSFPQPAPSTLSHAFSSIFYFLFSFCSHSFFFISSRLYFDKAYLVIIVDNKSHLSFHYSFRASFDLSNFDFCIFIKKIKEEEKIGNDNTTNYTTYIFVTWFLLFFPFFFCSLSNDGNYSKSKTLCEKGE